ncbi:acyltransferase [Pectinatus frisingensis]|uniref:acyltransferase n=1 Tax=Pectinatus frisingensis TaxID=865 RepID=UPI003D804812
MINYLINKYKMFKFKIKKLNIEKNFKVDKNVIFLPNINLDIRLSKKECGQIGEKSIVGCNFVFESSEGYISIGKRTYIGGGTNLISRSRIEIGNDVVIAWGCYIYDHNSHSLSWQKRKKDIEQVYADYINSGNMIANKTWDDVKTVPIKICDKVWIGFDAVILKGVTVGEGAVIAAKAVVTHDVPPYVVVAGNPAVVVKRLRK